MPALASRPGPCHQTLTQSAGALRASSARPQALQNHRRNAGCGRDSFRGLYSLWLILGAGRPAVVMAAAPEAAVVVVAAVSEASGRAPAVHPLARAGLRVSAAAGKVMRSFQLASDFLLV